MPSEARATGTWLVESLLLGWFAAFLVVWAPPPPTWLAGGPVVGWTWVRQLDAWTVPGVVLRLAECWLLGAVTAACARRLHGRAAGWARWGPRVGYTLLAARYDQPRLLGWQVLGGLLVGTLWLRGRWPARLGAVAGVAAWCAWPAPARGLEPVEMAPLTTALAGLLPLVTALSLLPVPGRLPSVEPRVRTLLLVAGAALLHLSATRLVYDARGWEKLTRDWQVADGRWDELLRGVRPGQPLSPMQIHDLDSALAARGELVERMFDYPQGSDALLLAQGGPCSFRYKVRLADQWLALGQVNVAEQALHNALPHTGDHPLLLRRLAEVYLLKEQPAAARLFLLHLTHDLSQGRWARDLLARLERDPHLGDDLQLAQRRARCLRRDDVATVWQYRDAEDGMRYDADAALSLQLDEQPANRLALDYLLALRLLDGRLAALPPLVDRLAAAGAREVPAPLEDGLVLAGAPAGRLPVRPAAATRVAAYRAWLRQPGADPRALDGYLRYRAAQGWDR